MRVDSNGEYILKKLLYLAVVDEDTRIKLNTLCATARNEGWNNVRATDPLKQRFGWAAVAFSDPLSEADFTTLARSIFPVEDDFAERDEQIIEIIHRCLTTPFSRNMLNGGMLKTLRKAIFAPADQVKLDVKMADVSCLNCGRKFGDREASTIQIERDGPILYCGACLPPTSIAPTGRCEHKIWFTEKEQSMFQRGCKECANEAKSRAQVEAQAGTQAAAEPMINWHTSPAPPTTSWIDEQLRAMSNARIRGTNPTPPEDESPRAGRSGLGETPGTAPVIPPPWRARRRP